MWNHLPLLEDFNVNVNWSADHRKTQKQYSNIKKERKPGCLDEQEHTVR